MSTNSLVMKAILSMDSYNRGYNANIKFGNLSGNSSIEALGIEIGNAKIIASSLIYIDGNGNRLDENIGFYAIAYEMPSDATWDGQTIISIRGTDEKPLAVV